MSESSMKGRLDLLMALARGELGVQASAAQITRRGLREAPLSFAQQRLWIMDQLQPGSTQFHVVVEMKLSGPLDVDALVRALDALQARHEVLRTVFSAGYSGPVQVVKDKPLAAVSIIDLAGLSREETDQFLSGEASKPFDLENGPLFRCLVAKLAPEEHELLLCMHHIVYDLNSYGILFRDLSALYEAEITGKPVDLPNLGVQYADYALWQRDSFENGLLAHELDYWEKRLNDAPAYLEVPTDYERPASPTFARGAQRVVIPNEASEQIRRLCREMNLTPFMFFLAVFMLLLGKYTARKDILVGTDVINRDRPEVQGLIGFFVNQLVLRADLSESATFREFLGRVRDVSLGACAHQDLPFDKLVERLRPARALERPPLFQVKLAFNSGMRAIRKLEGLSMRRVSRARDTAQLDMTLFMSEKETGIVGELEYRAELYKPETISKFVADLEEMVQSYAFDLDRRLVLEEPQPSAAIPEGSAEQRKQINRAKFLAGLSA